MRMIVVFLSAVLTAQSCWAWSEGGHHLIAVMAYDLLTEDEQREIQTILTAHPRFDEDFDSPKNVKGDRELEHWRIGRAGYWPDAARRTSFDRPNWHWQLGSTLTIGNVDTPMNPGPCPARATFESKDLHIAQAIELCHKTLNDASRPKVDRALAICWLAHLVADAHQPCHAGSLYCAGLFPNGDRGANSIPTKQSKNLHSLWDGLLGPKFVAGDIRRRANSITSAPETWQSALIAAKAVDGLNPLTWLAESSEYGRSHVYAPEVLSAIEAASRGTGKLETIDLSKEYLQAAGELAKVRAAYAAQRLVALLRVGISDRQK